MTEPVYLLSETGGFRQGEILTNLTEFRLDIDSVPGALRGEPPQVLPIRHPFAVVMTQDCDLEWDFRSRDTGKSPAKRMPNLLFCEVDAAQSLYSSPTLQQGNWKQIQRNKHERYHFLSALPPESDAVGEGLPETTIDFKRYFSIPTDEAYLQVANGAARRAVLSSPYKEHLATRFHYFQYRVALPGDHATEEQ